MKQEVEEMQSIKNVLLVSNGINRLFGNEFWKSLIKQDDAMKRGAVMWDQISNMPAKHLRDNTTWMKKTI